MNKIAVYQTIHGATPAEIDQGVAQLLSKGWQPFGGPYSWEAGPSAPRVAQAMVRYDAMQALFPGSARAEH